MALHWENPASTTHSLTPRLQNRPLFFGILTPCKKPEVAGSAGHCEPGVGRFTDPHPLTCYNIAPSFCWLMFGLCSLPSALSKPVLLVEENFAFQRGLSFASMRCPCRPGRACFFLSACSLSLLFDFPHERSPVLFHRKRRILRIRGLLSAVACGNCCSQTAHTAPTGPVWGSAGVVSPIRLSKPRTGPYRAGFCFHRFFLGCFCSGSAAKSFSNL